MKKYDYDFLVIGAGSGGVRASRIAATHGAKTAVIEKSALGGTCVNVGCVPKKLLSYASHFGHDFHDAVGFGWTIDNAQHDWQKLIEYKNDEIKRLNGIYNNILTNAGVELIDGYAKITGDHSVEVNGKHYTADKILIAVGGMPNVPDIDGAEHAITSDGAFYLKERPKNPLIIGGGYIAVEFASIFNGLGSDVTLLNRSELFLRGFDTDIRTTLAEEMTKNGVDLRFNSAMPTKIEKKANGDFLVTLSDGQKIETDCVMYAIGRDPNVKELGLENTSIASDPKTNAIIVNDNYQTSVDNIYAVGDVTNRINLTPVALAEGHVLADRLFNNQKRDISYSNVASAVFSNPTIATVGLTEDEAIDRGYDIDVYQSKFKPMKHTLSGRDEKTFMKLIVDTKTDKILGCHMVGLDAPEIIQGISIAINAGATKAVFDSTIGIHPTAAEELVTMRTPRPKA